MIEELLGTIVPVRVHCVHRGTWFTRVCVNRRRCRKIPSHGGRVFASSMARTVYFLICAPHGKPPPSRQRRGGASRNPSRDVAHRDDDAGQNLVRPKRNAPQPRTFGRRHCKTHGITIRRAMVVTRINLEVLIIFKYYMNTWCLPLRVRSGIGCPSAFATVNTSTCVPMSSVHDEVMMFTSSVTICTGESTLLPQIDEEIYSLF